MTRVNTKVAGNPKTSELLSLWIDAGDTALQRVPEVCEQVGDLLRQGLILPLDFETIRRAGILAATAQERLATCIAIQSRVGTYSSGGAFETKTCLATTDWEG